MGTLGKTGRDLTLLKRLPAWSDISIGESKERFIQTCLGNSTRRSFAKILTQFEQLVVYANAMNDG